MDEKLLHNLQKTLLNIKEAAIKEQASYYLVTQIDRAIGLIDIALPDIYDDDDDGYSSHVHPW